MKKSILIAVFFVLCQAASMISMPLTAKADIINGGFESGLTGWTVLGGIITTPSSYSSDYLPGSLSPFEGQHFLSAKSGGLMEGFAIVQQTVQLNVGDVISGVGAYDIGGMAVGSISVIYDATQTVIWSPSPQGGFEFNTSWTNWSWTAPETRDFTLSFYAGAMSSPFGASWATILVDGISVTSAPVPEPTSMLLLGLGLIGLAGMRRKLWK